MLSTQKLMQMANESYENEMERLALLHKKQVYQSGYYDGYLMGQPRKKKVSKTSTGKLATVGVGRK